MKDPQDDFGENPTRQSILHVFPFPFTCFCFGDFLTFFTWQPLFFFWSTIGSPSPLFFLSSHPELSFVQVSKSHPEKLETELQHTAEDSNHSPDNMFVASYVNHIAIASHILTVTFNAISFCKNLMFLFMLASFDHNVNFISHHLQCIYLKTKVLQFVSNFSQVYLFICYLN